MGAVPDYFLNNKNFGKHGNSDRFSSPSNTYKTKDGFIHIMAGSDDRFKGLVTAMNKKELLNNRLFRTPQSRINNQNKIDKIVNNWTKKNSTNFIGKLLSKNSVPWGHVRKFSQFLKSKTANNYIINGKIGLKNIKVPECAIKVPNSRSKNKIKVPKLGQDTQSILKKLGYKNSDIDILKKKKIL